MNMNFSNYSSNVISIGETDQKYGIKKRTSLRTSKGKLKSANVTVNSIEGEEEVSVEEGVNPTARSLTDEDKAKEALKAIKKLRKSKGQESRRPVRRRKREGDGEEVKGRRGKDRYKDKSVIYPNSQAVKMSDEDLPFDDSGSEESSCEIITPRNVIEVVTEVMVKQSAFSKIPVEKSLKEKRPREKSILHLATVDLGESHKRIDRKCAPYYSAQIGERIGEYTVLSILGRGSFGTVVKCQHDDGSEVAIKIVRRSPPFRHHAAEEVKMLKYLKKLGKKSNDMGRHFVVNYLRNFTHENHFCIVFELLSWSLLELIGLTFNSDSQKIPGLSLGMINKLALQLLRCLSFMKRAEVIHCDIKPENVALVSPERAHIKLLDFGSACHVNEVKANQFPYIQSRYYRAPEILLGYRYSYPIDMWSLGCLLYELYIGQPLFMGKDAQTQLYAIMDVIGYPTGEIIKNSVHREQFFTVLYGVAFPKNPDRYHFKQKTLWEKLNTKAGDKAEMYAFYDLIYRMLTYSPEDRITPEEALEHPFIKGNFGALEIPENPDRLRASDQSMRAPCNIYV